MAIKRLAEIDILVLVEIANKKRINQQTLSLNLNVSESTISRAVNRLQNLHLIKFQRVYKDKEWLLNRNKIKEILDIITLFEKCNSAILDKTKSVIIIHDIEILASVYVPKNYEKSNVNVYYTVNRKGINLTLPETSINIIIGNIESTENTAQILLRPLILVIETTNISEEQQLKDIVKSEILRVYEVVKEKMNY